MAGYVRNPYNNNPYSNNRQQEHDIGQNPVPSSVSSTEAMMRNLVSSSVSTRTNLSSIQATHEQYVAYRDIQWTLELALGIGKVVTECLWTLVVEEEQTDHEQDVAAASAGLQLLAAIMEDWDDSLVYAVLIQDCGNKPTPSNHLLSLITQVSLQPTAATSSTLHGYAISGLAISWRCLDRMQQYMTIADCFQDFSMGDVEDIPWWIDEQHVQDLSALSIEALYRAFSDHDGPKQPTIEKEQYKLSVLTLVASLLRRNLLDMNIAAQVLNQYQLTQITSKLLKGIQSLNHSVLPPSSNEYTLPISLISMSVLSLLQQAPIMPADVFHSLNQTIQSTRLVENIVDFTFLSPASTPASNASSSHVSRWVIPASKRFPNGNLQYFGLHVLSSWKGCQHAAWKSVVPCLGTKINQLLEQFFSVLNQGIQTSSSVSLEKLLPGIVWLSQYFCHETRRALLSVVTNMAGNTTQSSTRTATKHLLQSLFNTLNAPSGVSPFSRLFMARLLCLLLSDRRTVATHDELSRSLWDGIDATILEMHWNTVLHHISTEDNEQPQLLAHLDLMEVLLNFGDHRQGILATINAQDVEALIYLIRPKDVRYDFSQAVNPYASNVDSETPPQNNLSRLEDASICVEYEEVKQPRGWDYTVRVSAANVLGRVAYGMAFAATNESLAVLLSRTSVAVNDFFADCMKLQYQGVVSSSSLDYSRRLFRLQVAMAVPENEEFLSNALHTSRVLQRQVGRKVRQMQKTTEQDLKEAIQAKKRVEHESQELVKQMNAQRVIFQQTLSLTKTNAVQEVRQIVTLHSMERAKAEGMVESALQEATTATAAMEDIKAEASRMNGDIDRAQNELAKANKNVDELIEKVRELQEQLDEEKTKTKNLADQIHSKQEEMESFTATLRSLQNALHQSESNVVQEQGFNRELHSNLEDLFADMCSLAQIHQYSGDLVEATEKKAQEDIAVANEKLESERKKTSKLDDKVRLLEEENDKLYRKLAKYKDRLEQERKERKEELERRKEVEHRRKRNGPVSYLNSLHTSNISDVSRQTQDMSGRQAQSTRDHRTVHRQLCDRSNPDKENVSTSYYTNVSQLRTQYK
jgi:hypothetical protein